MQNEQRSERLAEPLHGSNAREKELECVLAVIWLGTCSGFFEKHEISLVFLNARDRSSESTLNQEHKDCKDHRDHPLR